MAGRGLAHPYFARPGPWLIAHRGGSALAPENTLEAFERAAALGADVVETDVRLSRDGQVMVFHDEETSRLCGVPGTIEGRTRAEIDALDAAWSFSPDGATFPLRAAGVRVPALADALARLPEVRFNVEAKSADPALARALADVLRRADCAGRVCVGSGIGAQGRRLRALLPEYARFLPTGPAVRHVAAAIHLLPARACPDGFDLAALSRTAGRSERVLRAVLRHFAALGVAVQIWTVNDEAEMARLLAAGVHGVMTDRPDLLRRVMGR